MKRTTATRVATVAATLAIAGLAACRTTSQNSSAPLASALVYEHEIKVAGLAGTVFQHKGPDGIWCRRPGGQRENCETLRKTGRVAYESKHGRMTPPLVATLDGVEDTDPRVFPAHVMFYVPPDAELRSADTTVRASAKQRFFSRVGEARSTLVAELKKSGVAVTSLGRLSMPLVTVRGTAAALRRVARTQSVARVMTANSVPAYPTDSGPTDAVVFNQTDQVFNGQGNYGAGQKVGLLGFLGGCRLWDDHEAFQAGASLHEFTAPQTCTSDNDCDVCSGLCRGGTCVDAHETQVASMISVGRSDQGYGASSIDIYHYNDFGINDAVPLGDSSGCNLEHTRDAYDWFVQTSNDVRIINESFTCVPPSGAHSADEVDGIAQDYYARVYDLFIARAAGNYGTGSIPACHYTLNSMCVGGMAHGGAMNDDSSWANPFDSDREEPDVVALSGSYNDGVEVAAFGSPTSWTYSNGGTSFAAPQVAQLAALYNEACGPIGGLAMRALYRSVAYAANPRDTNFSTPGLSSQPDYKDGAGYTTAETLLQGCGGGEALTIDLTLGVQAPFDAVCDSCGQPLEPISGILRPANSGLAWNTGDGRLYKRLRGVAAQSNRVRASLSWNSCMTANATTSPAPVSTDFDLFLVDEANERVIYSSQSTDDNNEGFDVDLTAFGSGDYAVWVGWPDGATGCDGNGTSEPVGYSQTEFN